MEIQLFVTKKIIILFCYPVAENKWWRAVHCAVLVVGIQTFLRILAHIHHFNYEQLPCLSVENLNKPSLIETRSKFVCRYLPISCL